MEPRGVGKGGARRTRDTGNAVLGQPARNFTQSSCGKHRIKNTGTKKRRGFLLWPRDQDHTIDDENQGVDTAGQQDLIEDDNNEPQGNPSDEAEFTLPESWRKGFEANIDLDDFPIVRGPCNGITDLSEAGRRMGAIYATIVDIIFFKESHNPTGQFYWTLERLSSGMNLTDALDILSENNPTYRGRWASPDVKQALTVLDEFPINKYAYGKCHKATMDYVNGTIILKRYK
jgi:hypothetical protein